MLALYSCITFLVAIDKRYKDPCDFQLYCGPKAASEKETQSIQSQLTKKFKWLLCSDELLKAKDHLDLLLTVHSFANAWLIPTARTIDGLGKKCAEIKDNKTADRVWLLYKNLYFSQFFKCHH